jgi:Cu+-exporting ATPase
METITWKVEGMTCSNCALTVSNFLQKEGLKNVRVNPIDGQVSFEIDGKPFEENKVSKGIEQLGYRVVNKAKEEVAVKKTNAHLRRFLICLPFTLLLMLDMIPGFHWDLLMNPWVKLILCLPVYVIGMRYFGRSAWKSLKNGLPNMNVLITLGATAAFVYSVIGIFLPAANQYSFFETSAAIITLVFLGNYLEDASVSSTQRALHKLAKSQRVMANMIAFDEHHHEVILPIESSHLKVGDLLLIRSGEQVPADCKILSGEANVNEALLTGESLPIHKKGKDKIIGGSVVVDGHLKAMVTAAGDETVLAGILRLVQQAQGEKPPMQKLADKISAIFVPVVIGIAIVTFIANYFYLSQFSGALMRSIAVLVIACPCAMGLATPAAIAVGLGRSARNGILFRNATNLENFRHIQQVVFDKTGTLTTGQFIIRQQQASLATEDELKRIAYSLEKYSTHPIARTISKACKTRNEIKWKKIEEVKGMGMHAWDHEGNEYWAGSHKVPGIDANEKTHSVYIVRNQSIIGWFDVKDEVRREAKEVIALLKKNNIRTILLSGDRMLNCKSLADELGIDEVFAEQSPKEKMDTIKQLNKEVPTAMVGDGINDAPALAEASIGISLSDASQLAMQTAGVVLMNQGIRKLPMALGMGKHTYRTIKQNLFWAFFYNILAIPIAAVGLLSPTLGALVMGLSDVVLGVNSVRLFSKKVY